MDYPAAIANYRDALDLYRSLSESAHVAAVLSDLARAEQRSGDSRRAERDNREALRMARAAEFVHGVARVTGNLAGWRWTGKTGPRPRPWPARP